MATAILLPKQGQSVESCIITEFYVSVGDRVDKGTPLFAYETDKAAFEEEAAESGTILALFFEAGDEVPVLTNIGVIGEEGESIEAFRPATDEQPEGNAPETEDAPSEIRKQEIPASKASSSLKRSDGPVFISPRARKLAEKRKVAYADISGSGPQGRIIEADILAYLEGSPRVTPLAKRIMEEEGLVPDGTRMQKRSRITSKDLVTPDSMQEDTFDIVPLTNIRKRIADAMHRSLQNSAQLTHHLGADARRLLEIRKRIKSAMQDGYQYNITLNDMICHTVINALKQFPRANAHFLGDSLQIFRNVHLGLAVDTERGLMVPSVRNANQLDIAELSTELKTVAEQCRSGSVNPDILLPEAASFSVSNLGNYGVEMFTPVLNLPQVAILGVNTIVPRPKDLGGGTYAFVPHIGLSLTYDHRALDGGEATRFLKTIADEIENLDVEL